ncbi:serpin family protein [Nonomuraea soli]|uniref:Serpin B n=1 Tax=Nonomuraea soli TaxID=1032476 RepID=A0A7W0CKM7_9ACTN|nr:serpin family protein [Nonomuraea soli]MBA2892712.1 serpin B [Nonomuraea soli]
MRRLLAGLLVFVAACGSTGDADVITAVGVERETVREAPVEETVRGLTAFACELYGRTARPAENHVISPLSIAYAYGMARAGAAPATGTELDALFGFPAEGPHTAFNLLTSQIVTTYGPPPPAREREENEQRREPPVVAIANGLFTQRGFTPKQPFLHTLAAQYGTGVREVDFRGDATKVIDAWADEQTAGRIKKVFDRLDPDTKAVITNAVYLRADWDQPFGKEPPEQAAFTRGDGTTVQTTLMRHKTPLRYAEGEGWQAVELRYAESELAMWVLVPPAGTAPAGLLSPQTLRQVGSSLKELPVDLAMPKWDFGTSIDLRERIPLKSNDFSGIADGLFLGAAIHRATITVDEQGTEAAAVTGMAFPASAGPQAEAVVRADHPFAFVIVHLPTRTPLFLGHVAAP